jgi:hypothetical protein
MQAAQEIEDADDRRDIGVVAVYHPLDQSEVPKQDAGKQAEAGEDQPGKQRIAFSHAESLSKP